jgi:hypothetical protein
LSELSREIVLARSDPIKDEVMEFRDEVMKWKDVPDLKRRVPLLKACDTMR